MDFPDRSQSLWSRISDVERVSRRAVLLRCIGSLQEDGVKICLRRLHSERGSLVVLIEHVRAQFVAIGSLHRDFHRGGVRPVSRVSLELRLMGAWAFGKIPQTLTGSPAIAGLISRSFAP